MHTSQYTTKAYSLHIKRIRTMTQNSANATDLSSLLFPKPLWFYIIRYFSTSNNPQQEAAFNAAWQYPQFRAYIRNVTILWGIVYVVEFLIRIVMVYTMPISQFLIISPIIFYGITILVIWITIRSGARLRKRAASCPSWRAGIASFTWADGRRTFLRTGRDRSLSSSSYL